MRLAGGSRLGPYEIQSPIGSGGMGEVYRARDTRLERSVAMKILPSEFCADALYKQRFEREAKAISRDLGLRPCAQRARTESFSALTAFAAVWSPDGLAFKPAGQRGSYLSSESRRARDRAASRAAVSGIDRELSIIVVARWGFVVVRPARQIRKNFRLDHAHEWKSQAVPVHGDAVQRTNGAIFARWPVGCVRFE
jgi:hypothetical protein